MTAEDREGVESLSSLGVLSAGLAHELNNPVAAAQRSASKLREHLTKLREASLALASAGVALSPLAEIAARAESLRRAPSDPLERSDLESRIGDTLKLIDVESPYDVAHTLVELGATPEEVEALVRSTPCESVAIGLDWLAHSVAVDTLAGEIEEAMGRVVGLVNAVKGYSTTEHAPPESVDVREGLNESLRLLAHKIEARHLRITREYAEETPGITARALELKQVWTNLLDNAIAASSEGGELVLRTAPEGDGVRIEVEDHGEGIPVEDQTRIFEPFFTTKEIGDGTGLGLNICFKIVVEHHGGDIGVQSQPGRTVFTVRLPIAPPA